LIIVKRPAARVEELIAGGAGRPCDPRTGPTDETAIGMQSRLLELTQRDLRGQVASLLLNETEDRAGEIQLPQSTLAELLGATRPSVNQVLKSFQAEGLVRLSYRRVEVLDPERLRRVAS
jgi:hypothetical protein